MAAPGRHVYEYPRPAVTADALVFVLADTGLEVLLVERGHEPFAGSMALPGGFVDPDEPLAAAARRELLEETGVTAGTMIQVGAFGDPGRDPRGHTVGVAFLTLMRREVVLESMRAGDDAAGVALHPAHDPPPLAFDHGEMLDAALDLLRCRSTCEPFARALLADDAAAAELRAAQDALECLPG